MEFKERFKKLVQGYQMRKVDWPPGEYIYMDKDGYVYDESENVRDDLWVRDMLEDLLDPEVAWEIEE